MKISKKITSALGAILLTALTTSQATARDNIQIVGSSTVFPFSTTVAENFARSTSFPAPVVESTGSGGGLKLFCSGLGVQYPDITNSSRAIKKQEIEQCKENGVTDIIEVIIGYDGIVMGNSTNGDKLSLTRQQIFQALAAELPDNNGNLIKNPNKIWSDIAPNLPNYAIKILGPPPTSGTRDAFLELAMETGAVAFPSLKELKGKDKDEFKRIAHTIREDGVFVEAGENDNLIVNKLSADKNTFGIFGFSFLDQNSDKIQGINVGGVEAEFESIADGSYSLSRPLFFYVKKAHIGTVPGMKEYLDEFTSDKAWGDEGYLADKGLIPLPMDERNKILSRVQNLEIIQ